MSGDIVQCVSARKGHQILYKGYTYVFKSRLQCGSEQWCCTSRQKTVQEEALPEWVLIYFVKKSESEFTCSLCQAVIAGTERSGALLQHVQDTHKEIHDLHKDNPQGNVGFHIEYLELNVPENENADPKSHPVILGEICEAATEEITSDIPAKSFIKEIVVKAKKKRAPKRIMYIDASSEAKILEKELQQKESQETTNRKRSWVWKYFTPLSNIIFRCNLCHSVLSIKGCNTNNMNRHIRSRHTSIYTVEIQNKSVDSEMDLTEVETPMAVKTEEISASDKDLDDSSGNRLRRSWIWTYFERTSATTAQCKLCRRLISHGGNATGNMNRHLKMIHHKTPMDYSWIWKVFEDSPEDGLFTCKICQYRVFKNTDNEKNIQVIVDHLKDEHGVISGDQIITGTDDGEE